MNFSLKDLYESETKCGDLKAGQKRFHEKIHTLLKNGDVSPEDFSIRAIYEAVPSSMFPIITGEVISKKIMDAYKAAPRVGKYLVTRIKSNKKIEKIPGWSAVGTIEEVKESEEYPRHGITEKEVEISNKKYGDIIEITEEAITFDQTGAILMRAQGIAEAAAAYEEQIILNTIQDLTGYKAYYPKGTQTDLYSAGHGNLVTSNALADWTDINNALVKLANMTDENGNPILIQPKAILVPWALYNTARYIVTNTKDTRQSYNADAPDLGNLAVFASRFLDAQSTSTWYLGDFARQFVWTEVWPLQVFTQTQNSEDAFKRDVFAKYKVRFYGGCGALDYRFVVKNTA